MLTFLSVIRQNFEYNLGILAYFCVKTQKSMISNVHFQKTSLKKIILFTLKIYFLQRKMPKVS